MRVIIVDYHQIVRVGLRVILEQTGDIQVVGEAGFAHEALSLFEAQQPDVAIVDLDLPDGSGLSLVPQLSRAAPGVRVLLLSVRAGPELVRRALAAGVHGYLAKEAGAGEVVQAVRSLAAGRAFLSIALDRSRWGEVPASEPQQVQSARSTKVARPLSGRERQVLELFALGHTHRQIAEILGVRAKTVETYRSRLGDKFGVRSRAELLRNARRLGFLGARETAAE